MVATRKIRDPSRESSETRHPHTCSRAHYSLARFDQHHIDHSNQAHRFRPALEKPRDKIGHIINVNITVTVTCEDATTTVTLGSPIPLLGLQLTLSGTGGSAVHSPFENSLDVLGVLQSDQLVVGLADLDGVAVIPSGRHQVLRLDGEYRIVSALASDMRNGALALTILDPDEESLLPTAFALHQNYPNPFNPVTQISFSLPSAGDVRLVVYNIMGQHVTTLVDGRVEVGHHTVAWDATNAPGERVASGVYLYRLESTDFVQTKKMLLLK